MNVSTDFAPPTRKGTILFLGLTLLLMGASGFLFIFALDQQSSGFFALALLAAILALSPVPFIIYALYSLRRARYALNREGLKIRWGLRSVDIPMPEIDWVRTPDSSPLKLPMPAWSFSGLLRGLVHSPDLGEVEFLASDQNRLVLIGTPKKVYAISPENKNSFLKSFQSMFELGAITPLKASSTQAGTFFSSIFKDRLARTFILLDLALLALLLITTAILISSRQTVIFGYQTAALPGEPAPSDRLLLLPALNFFSLVAVFTGGFFFFRNPKTRNLAYITLASGLISPILFFIVILFIR
jgi:hypothetical protein